jgi:hypothetical protein
VPTMTTAIRPLATAEQLRAHLLKLLALRGPISQETISVRSSVDLHLISTLLVGDLDTLGDGELTAAAAVLELPLPDDPDVWVDATGTARRAHALVAAGYAPDHVAAMLRIGVSELRGLLRLRTVGSGSKQRPGERSDVPADVARRAEQAFDECTSLDCLLRMHQFGHMPGAADAAHLYQCFPPLAWSDDTIDDPHGYPCLLPPVEGSDPAISELAIQEMAAGFRTLPGTDRATRTEFAWRRRGDMKNTDLAKLFDVGRETIRMDLTIRSDEVSRAHRAAHEARVAAARAPHPFAVIAVPLGAPREALKVPA